MREGQETHPKVACILLVVSLAVGAFLALQMMRLRAVIDVIEGE